MEMELDPHTAQQMEEFLSSIGEASKPVSSKLTSSKPLSDKVFLKQDNNERDANSDMETSSDSENDEKSTEKKEPVKKIDKLERKRSFNDCSKDEIENTKISKDAKKESLAERLLRLRDTKGEDIKVKVRKRTPTPPRRDKNSRSRSRERIRRPRSRSSDKRRRPSPPRRRRSHSKTPERRKDRRGSRRSKSRSPFRKRRRSRSRSHGKSRKTRSPSPKRKSRSPSRSKRSRSRSGSRSQSKARRNIGPKRYWSSRSPSPAPRYEMGSGICRAVQPKKKIAQEERIVSTEEVEKRLAKHMEKMQQKAAEEAKGVIPGYLNPQLVNVQQYKQVQEKRKLLWSSKKDEKQDGSAWAGAFEESESDQKFRKLMGIHGDASTSSAQPSDKIQKSKAVLKDLENEYENARQFTLSRGAGGVTGIGLGFGSYAPPLNPNLNPNPPNT